MPVLKDLINISSRNVTACFQKVQPGLSQLCETSTGVTGRSSSDSDPEQGC